MSTLAYKMRGQYQVVAVKTSDGGLTIDHTDIELGKMKFSGERELYEAVMNKDPNAKYIILESVNG